jgi:hypothetical protein
MKKLIFNVEEPKGKDVIDHATGHIEHVAKPKGDEYIQQLFSGQALKRASAALKGEDKDLA